MGADQPVRALDINPQPSSALDSIGRPAETALGYSAIVIFVLLSYVTVVGLYFSFTNHVLPSGDPFRYTVGWFRTVDFARSDYFSALSSILQGHWGGWYRLMYIMIAVLSPLMTKDPVVLCVVNYLIWGLGTAAFYRLGRHIGLGAGRAFAISLVPWIWPVNYGFLDNCPLPALALDASFYGALLLALGHSFVFAFNPHSMKSAIIAGLSIGVAVWGRGNSAPVVALVVGWPCLLAVLNAWRSGDQSSRRAVAVAGMLAASMTVEFYWTYWSPIADYYGQHAKIFDHHHWHVQDVMPYLKNIPGLMYWRNDNSAPTMGLSWISHLVPLIALTFAWGKGATPTSRRDAAYRQLSAAGAFIYFGTFFVNLASLTHPLFGFLFIWRPMLIGLSLSLIVLFLKLTDRLQIKNDLWMMFPIGSAAILWGIAWNSILMPWDSAIGRPDPRTVERFALDVDQLLEESGSLGIFNGSGSLSVLWYENWNLPILQYYRLKNDRAELPEYHGKNGDNIWIWSEADYLPEERALILDEIKEHFQKAGLIIIAEYLDDYALGTPLAVFRLKNDWAAWLNSPDAPRLRVRMLLQESPTVRLLVLQREDLARDRGDPFRLPWGNRPTSPPADYSNAVIRVPIPERTDPNLFQARPICTAGTCTTANGLRLIYPIARNSGHAPDRAFDGSTAADSFWEAAGPFPIELTIELPKPTVLSSYALDAGEAAARMPSDWTVEGSEDGQKWIPLDQQKVTGQWAPNESRSFRISSNRPLRRLRYRFLAGYDPGIFRVYEIELR
jgi:hypothetical protein